MELSSFAFGVIKNLLMLVIRETVQYDVQKFFEQRRIERRIEDSIADAVEPLIPFLSNENISEDKQRRLIQTCADELKPFTKSPERLFHGSLNGQKIFEELYAERDLPEVVIEDDVKEIYSLLCPRVATLLCKIPAAVKDWENEAWSENFRRFDEITNELAKIYITVDTIATSSTKRADDVLINVRRAISQKIRLELDLTGLRADRPYEGKIDDFFIHPSISQQVEEDKLQGFIGSAEKSLKLFTHKQTSVVIYGVAGAGKSTWSKWFQRETLVSEWAGISIRVELRKLVNEKLVSFHDLIRASVGKHFAEELTTERIAQWLDKKLVIFILDGFDEVPPDKREDIVDWILELQSAIRGCPLIITSRILTTDHLDNLIGWEYWNIDSFDEPRIIKYIERWYTSTPLNINAIKQVDAKLLASTWRDDPTIEPLTGNPLLLSTLLMVNHLDGSLPSGRSELYKRYVEGMLGLWDDRRQVTATNLQLSLEEKRQIIRGFAIKLFFEEKDQLDESSVITWLRKFLKEKNIKAKPNQVLDMLMERSGLIVGPGIFSFAHKSIAEFLVAETVFQGDQHDVFGNRIDRFRLFEHKNDDRWNTVIFLWAGLAPFSDVEGFVEKCIEVGDYSLALGMLNDQYERIPFNLMQELVLNITRVKGFQEDSGFSVTLGILLSAPKIILQDKLKKLITHGKSKKSKLSVNNLMLRGLNSTIFITEICGKLIKDNFFTTKNIAKCSKYWIKLIWISYFHIPQLQLSADVSKKIIPLELKEDEIVWAGTCLRLRLSSISEEHNYSTEAMEKTINDYVRVYPKIKTIVPLLIISSISDQRYDYDDFQISSLIQILSLFKKDKNIDSQWLSGSVNWVMNFPHEGLGEDILVKFKEILVSLERSQINRDIFEEAIKYVDELLNERDKLLSK